MKTFKIIGMLLSYPKQDLINHLDELESILVNEALLPKRSLKKVGKFLDHLRTTDIYELQEDYVSLFDRGRAHCLHLFEHIHGESRDRGQAMVNLVESYAERGFYMSNGELPDYLPLFLEYLSHCPVKEAVDLVGDPINVIATIGIRLEKRKSPYRILFQALEALAKVKPDEAILKEVRAAELKEQTLDELDEEWEETEAFDNNDCGNCSISSGSMQDAMQQSLSTRGAH